jgi:hypothetical protein
MRAGSWSFFEYPAANSGLDLTDHNREAARASTSASFFGFLPGACIASARIAKALAALLARLFHSFRLIVLVRAQ